MGPRSAEMSTETAERTPCPGGGEAEGPVTCHILSHSTRQPTGRRGFIQDHCDRGERLNSALKQKGAGSGTGVSSWEDAGVWGVVAAIGPSVLANGQARG